MTQSAGKNVRFSKNLALLGACCLFLSAVEYMIPKPMPFIRIGLANLPLMLALDIFPLSSFLVLICIKVFGQAIITGTLFSYIFLFSFAGTFSSALLMYALRKIFGSGRISFVGIGVAGAMVSNTAQLSLAYYFLFRENARYIAPLFFASGLVTGIALGVFCEVYTRRSKWYAQGLGTGDKGLFQQSKITNSDSYSQFSIPNSTIYDTIFSANVLFIAGLLVIPALLFNPSTEYRVLQFLFLWLLVLLSGKKSNVLVTVLIIAAIVIFNLIIPYGKVLFSIGPFRVTSGALKAGVHRAVTFQALVMLSKVSIRHDLKIPGVFGELLSESLRTFSCLMSRKFRITRKDFFGEIDKLLLELGEKEDVLPVFKKQRTTLTGYFILIVVVFLSWLPWLKLIP